MITVNVGNATAKNAVKVFYDLVLNDLREAEIYTDGSDSTLNSEYSTSAVVSIWRDSTLEFRGEVIEKMNTQGGGVIMYCIGQEEELTETDCPVTGATHSKVWLSTGANTIFDDIVTTTSGWTTDVTNSTNDTLDSFKVTDSMSCWNGIQKFLKTTNKDIIINDAEKRIYLYDSKNRTGKASFNEGANCGNVSYSEKKASATKVIVYGKGDGAEQVIGEAGSGTPVKKIIDRSIITTAEANTRAAAELSLIVNSIYHYNFNCYSPNEDVVVGDTVNLNAPSANVFNADVDIVKIRRGVVNDSESLSLQVTNTSHRVAKNKQIKEIYGSMKNYETSQSAMQGNTVTNEWGTGINADSTHPAKVGFYIPSEFVNEDGNLNPVWLRVDYDIDPYNSQFGTASFTGTDPQVQNSSGDNDADVENTSGQNDADVEYTSGSTAPDVQNSSGSTAPDVENSSGSTGPGVSGTTGNSGSATWSSSYSGNSAGVGSGTLTDSSWTTVTNTTNIYLNSDLLLYFITFKNDNALNTRTVRVRAYIDSTYFPSSAGTYTEVEPGNYVTIPILMPIDIYGDDVFVQAQTESGDMDYEFTWNYQLIGKHTHSDGSLATDSHTHGDGTYAAANHSHDDGTYAAANHSHDDGSYNAIDHSHSDGSYNAIDHSHPDGSYDINAADLNFITIGDSISEAGGVNATGATIYLDFWNGSSWINKHSAVYGTDTLKEDVDMTDSGTYPDTEGYWRVRVTPNSASADFVNAKVRLKFKIDN